MRGAILRALLYAAGLVLLSGPAGAAPPPDVTGPLRRDVRKSEEAQTIGIDPHRTTLAGIVMDVDDKPVAGVTVSLFVDGERLASAVTAADGYYELRAHFDYRADATSILWYLPSDRALLAKAVVLGESRVSRENKLISPCVPRATVTLGHQFRVYLFDPADRSKELEEMRCLP